MTRIRSQGPARIGLDLGERLTSGSSLAAAPGPLPVRLAGTRVEVDGDFVPLLRVSPGEIVAGFPAGPPASATMTVWSGTSASRPFAYASRLRRFGVGDDGRVSSTPFPFAA